jgi:hypothetical protein
MTDFFKPVTAKQSAAAEDGHWEQPSAAPVLQTIPNGQPRRGSADPGTSAQQPAAAAAPPTGKQPRRPRAKAAGVDGSDQPDAKRQRTLGGGTVSEASAKDAQKQRQRSAQPSRPPPGVAVIDITVSDATAASREPAAGRDAAAGEDVSSQQPNRAADPAATADVARGSDAKHLSKTTHYPQQPGIEPNTRTSVAGRTGSNSVVDEGPAVGGGPGGATAGGSLASLEALGFGKSQARAALLRCGNDLERAANLLCSGMA